MKKNRDVKFIIYQSLYIFVVCVIALKGANLDLVEVMPRTEDLVEKSYADSLKKYVDSLLAKGIIPELTFDTSKKFTSPADLQKKLAEVQKQLVSVQNMTSASLNVNTTSPNLSVSTENPNVSVEEKEKEKEKTPETEFKEDKAQVDFKISQTFIQYTTNTASNSGNLPIEIYGNDGGLVATVPPGGSKSFQLGNQTSLTFKSGGISKTVSVKENAKPKLVLQRLAPSGEGVSVRTIQATTGYRITVSDDFPGQLDINFTGPVSVKQSGPNTYDVTLKFLGSKTAFDNYTDNKEEPYTVSFQVIVKDKIAGHSLTQTGVFQFTEW